MRSNPIWYLDLELNVFQRTTKKASHISYGEGKEQSSPLTGLKPQRRGVQRSKTKKNFRQCGGAGAASGCVFIFIFALNKPRGRNRSRSSLILLSQSRIRILFLSRIKIMELPNTCTLHLARSKTLFSLPTFSWLYCTPKNALKSKTRDYVPRLIPYPTICSTRTEYLTSVFK
jgi:hypothetical protein